MHEMKKVLWEQCFFLLHLSVSKRIVVFWWSLNESVLGKMLIGFQFEMYGQVRTVTSLKEVSVT